MFDLPEDKEEALRLAGLGTEVLATIYALVKGGQTPGVFAIIQQILDSLKQSFEGQITVDQVRAEMKKLTSGLAANDAAADQALRNKFEN